MKILKKIIVMVVVCFLVTSCQFDSGAGDTKFIYVPEPGNLSPYVAIYNGINQHDKNIMGGEYQVILSHVAFDTHGSQEPVIVHALVLEDIFTGTGDFTEIANIRIIAGMVEEDSPSYMFGAIVSDGYGQPVAGPSPATITIPLVNGGFVIPQDDNMIFTIVADTNPGIDVATPGQHSISVQEAFVSGENSGNSFEKEDGGLIFLNQGVVLTNVDRGTLNVSYNSLSPNSRLISEGEDQQIILVFDIENDLVEDIKLFSINFGLEGTAGITGGSIESSAGWTGYQPIPASGGGNILLPSQPVIPKGSTVTVYLKIKANVGIPYSLNGDSFKVTSISFSAQGLSSNNAPHKTGQVESSLYYIYETYPMASLNAGSPDGMTAPSAKTLLAVFDVSAAPGNDLYFSFSESSYFRVNITTNCSLHNGTDTFTLEDDIGTVYSTFGMDICSNGRLHFDFNNNDLTIAENTTKQLYLYADTTDMVSGDIIQAYLSEEYDDNIVWSILTDPFGGGQYQHAGIIYYGNVFANAIMF